MAVPFPDLHLTVTPPGEPGTDMIKYLTYSGSQQQMQITQNFGRQGDTALFPLQVEHDGTTLPFTVPPMSQIAFHDSTAGQTLFAGVVTDPALCPRGANLAEWDLACTDYTIYADAAIVRWPASDVQASDQIIVDLTNGAQCGISAKTVRDGGYVAPGPSMPELAMGYMALSAAWRQLASVMGQVVPYGWFVDENRHLHFYDQNSALDSGVTFTTKPTRAGSLTEGHIMLDSQFKYEWDGTSLRNRVLVQGSKQLISANLDGDPTDQWQADGVTTAWPLRWTVASGASQVTTTSRYPPQPGQVPATVLYVGGVYTQVTKARSGTVQSTPWAIVSNTGGAFFLSAQSPPPAGTEIQIWYTYEAPIVVQATDAGSVTEFGGAPNRGIYAKFVNDSGLTTAPMALARAMQDRTEYAFPVERVTFNTSPDFLGWVRAGYTFTLDCALVPDYTRGGAMGVNAPFLCIANTVTFGQGGYRKCLITGVRI